MLLHLVFRNEQKVREEDLIHHGGTEAPLTNGTRDISDCRFSISDRRKLKWDSRTQVRIRALALRARSRPSVENFAKTVSAEQ